jgi:hypothetical protein
MRKVGDVSKFFLFMAAIVIFLPANTGAAVDKKLQGKDVLLDTYHRIETKLEKNSFGFPLYLESYDRDGRLHVDVYGMFDHSFGSILNVLKVPANWCEIAALHPNVKACVYRELPGTWQLTLYGGRKVYQSPGDSHRFTYYYRNIELQRGYLDIFLSSDEGPFGTKDHRIRFEALSLDGGMTFVHVSCAYSYGSSLRFAEKIYFATLGRSKVGFTVDATDYNGKPVYVGGARGAIERNAVRYYFAIKSFMDALRYPEQNRFTMMIDEWYDLTSLYRKQLFEMDKKDYLTYKTEEHKNHVMLQRQISPSLQ